jgi:hypothetical protein
MAEVVILIPWRPTGNARREYLWKFVKTKWIPQYQPEMNYWDIWSAPGPLDGPFNRGAAINEAAKIVDDWDVAIIHDADTICSPMAIQAAVFRVRNHGSGVVYPFETYTYLDQWSSDRIVKYGQMGLISPERHPTEGFRTTVRHHHVSGAMVVSRSAWDKVGGFIELSGWGAEDEIMHWLFKTFATEPVWMKGGAYHLYHPAARNDGSVEQTTNHQILADVMSLAPAPDQLRDYLKDGGHDIP